MFGLFVWSFSSHSRIFHSFGDVTSTGEGLQILTYAQHLWPLSREGSLACHTYCDMGHLFILVFSESPWHSHLLPSVWQWSCHYLFKQHGSVAAGIRTPNLALVGPMLKPIAPLPWSLCYAVFIYFYWLHTNSCQQFLSLICSYLVSYSVLWIICWQLV